MIKKKFLQEHGGTMEEKYAVFLRRGIEISRRKGRVEKVKLEMNMKKCNGPFAKTWCSFTKQKCFQQIIWLFIAEK